MSTKDHNKTLVMLYAAIGSFYSCGIIAAPWIVEKNFRRPEQIPTAILYLDWFLSSLFSSGYLRFTCTGASVSVERWRLSPRR